MLSTTTGQVGFFDAAELIGPAPEGSFFVLLAEHGERNKTSAELSRRVEKAVGYPPLVEVDDRCAASSTRRCSTPTASRVAAKWQPAIRKAEAARPQLRVDVD